MNLHGAGDLVLRGNLARGGLAGGFPRGHAVQLPEVVAGGIDGRRGGVDSHVVRSAAHVGLGVGQGVGLRLDGGGSDHLRVAWQLLHRHRADLADTAGCRQSGRILERKKEESKRIKSLRTSSYVGEVFLACEVSGEMFEESFPVSAFSFSFFPLEIARMHQFHSLGQDQSTVAQRDKNTVDGQGNVSRRGQTRQIDERRTKLPYDSAIN